MAARYCWNDPDRLCQEDCEARRKVPGPYLTDCLILESLAGSAFGVTRLADTFGGLSQELASMGPGMVGKFAAAMFGGKGRKQKPEDSPAGGM